MLLRRAPVPELRPFVSALWATSEAAALPQREHVLPTGGMSLVFRVDGAPLRLFRGPEDHTGTVVARAVLGGARSSFYVRETGGAGRSFGVLFAPGGAARLLGLDVDDLAERHTPIGDLWGRAAEEEEERLSEARSPAEGLARLELMLVERLAHGRRGPACVADALRRFVRGGTVAEAVRASGRSHRSFLEHFRRSVGLAPKVHCRVRRFQTALAHLRSGRQRSLAGLALAAGYSDQAHFNREFRALAGLTPGQYLRLAPVLPYHVGVT